MVSIQLPVLLEFLRDRWSAIAFMLVVFWVIGWLDLISRGARRPIIKSGIVALACISMAVWGWLQQPIFLEHRWLAAAPLAIWAALIRLVGLWDREDRSAPSLMVTAPSETRPSASEQAVLRQSRSTLAIGVVCFLFFGVITVVSNLYPNDTVTIGTTATFVGFALLGVLVILAAMIERIELGEHGLRARNMFGCWRSVRWEEVASLGFNSSMQWFYMRTHGRRVVRVSAMMTGLPVFARQALLRLAPEAIDEDLHPVLRALAES
jgi:hypothetical protein